MRRGEGPSTRLTIRLHPDLREQVRAKVKDVEPSTESEVVRIALEEYLGWRPRG